MGSLFEKCQGLLEEWDFDKNKDIDLYSLAYTSRNIIWWKCDLGHEWQSSLNARARAYIKHGDLHKNRCPYCSSIKLMNYSLYSQWNFNRNEKLNSEIFPYRSNKKVWWKCEYNHEWEARVSERVGKKLGCPYCSHHKVCKETSLFTTHADLCKEWNYNKNTEITPDKITSGSARKVWWICNKGHEYRAKILERVGIFRKSINRIDVYGCPYCSGHKVCSDNCLEVKFPELAQQWNYERNYPLTPNDFTFASGKKVWWRCKNGHEWKSIISNRSVHGRGCSKCYGYELLDGTVVDSYIEAFYYLILKNANVIFEYNKEYNLGNGKSRFDFYLPIENIYIETTSFNTDFAKRKNGLYFGYLRKIVKKRKHVESIGSNFEFIQRSLTIEEKRFVMENIK